MNATLEAMARTLFRSWFVDFDPVRAKMEGRDIGLPKEIADLFPDRLAGSELGEIPLGWPARALQIISSSERRELQGLSSDWGRHAAPQPKLNSRGGWIQYEGIKFYSGEYAERHRVRPAT